MVFLVGRANRMRKHKSSLLVPYSFSKWGSVPFRAVLIRIVTAFASHDVAKIDRLGYGPYASPVRIVEPYNS